MFSMDFATKIQGKGLGTPLFLPFTKGFHTSSGSTSATWGFSCVKLLDRFLRTVIFWSLHFKGLLHRSSSLSIQCDNIQIATVEEPKE